MSLCKDCISGVTHEGTPTGQWEIIGTINCYVATPTSDYPKEKVIIYLTDGFGPQLVNNRLLADDFAKNGFKTVIPDYLHGDPIPVDALNSPDSNFNVTDWMAKHGPEQTRPPVDKVIAALKETGVTSFGGTGYCLGGRYVFDLAFENIIKVSAVSHPTFLQVPTDLEKYLTESRSPLLINGSEFDDWFPPSAGAKADEILGEGKFAPGYRHEYFEGCTHGFAVRGDMSNTQVKKGKEGSFKSTVEWMKKYL
ncbi:chlorocatechol-degradation protein [Gymnopus androsaceus JB14]|uniref:Chlorocatechol-degradation protein n=1 Tax=Gymnopus androsaceus JB14 TaxID=1447944 RepID=A0A6A4GZI0_9AGAR|nr:chlorocatechol-degradation protein [Gymnopus androsaceus JB14]